MKTVRTLVLVSNRPEQIIRGYKYTIKTIHNQFKCSLVNLDNFSFRHFFRCMFSYSCAYTFDVSLVCFNRHFRTVSKLKEKGYFGKKFCKFKILEWDLYFLCTLKWLHEFIFFSDTNSAFSSGIRFSIVSILFQDFLCNQVHTAKIPLWFFKTQGSTIDSIYELLLFSRAPQDSIDTTVSLNRLFFLL